MKTRISILAFTAALFCSFFLLSVESQAHFGSKGPFGGSVTCGTVNDTTVYFGTAFGGVYESTKQALTGWRARPVGLKSGRVYSLAHSGKYLFAGTADSGVYIFNGYVGSDRYWRKINNGLGNLRIRSLVALDSITVLAGTEGGGLYKTINKGGLWTPVNSAALNNGVIAGLIRNGNRIFAIRENSGVFISEDGGASWTTFNDMNTANISGTRSFTYNAATDELLVLNNNGLFLATNAGSGSSPTYVAVSGPAGAPVIRSLTNNGTYWFLSTGSGVFRSSTGSISWSAQNSGLNTVKTNVIIPFQTRLVLGTEDEGVFKSSASSISWTANNTSFNNLRTFSMATSGDVVIVAATEKGVFASRNLATTYTRANDGLTDSLQVNDLEFHGTDLYAATKEGGVFISADTGTVWTPFNSGLTTMNVKKIISTSSYVYVICDNGMVYQSNGGSGWNSIQQGLPSGIEPTSLAGFGNHLLLGAHGHGVFIRRENNGTWQSMNNGLSNLNVTSVTACGTKIFAGTDGNGVFVSDRESINWSAASPVSISHTQLMNLDGSHIEAMSTFGGYVFASYRGGLLATADYGATWIAGGNQFNLPSYTSVHKISFVTTRVFVTTENNSLYSNSLSELDFQAGLEDFNSVSCNDDCNGWARIAFTGGTSPYTVTWSHGPMTAELNDLCPGTYNFTVTDAENSTKTGSVVIGEPATLSLDFEAVPTTTNTGSAEAIVTGGTPPYTYVWSNDGTSSMIDDLEPGTYSVDVTDANGCEVTGSVIVDETTGILDSSLENTLLRIYPNPGNGEFIVQCENDKVHIEEVNMVDAYGRFVFTEAFRDNASSVYVNQSLAPGLYYMHVRTSERNEIHKVVVR